eukprot:1850859-Rhodomonas_salina.1
MRPEGSIFRSHPERLHVSLPACVGGMQQALLRVSKEILRSVLAWVSRQSHEYVNSTDQHAHSCRVPISAELTDLAGGSLRRSPALRCRL